LNKEEFISSGLLELYALDISSPEEKQMVEEHLLHFPELKQELNDIEDSLESYAQANALQPSSSAKDKVMSRVFADKQQDKNTPAPVISINKEIKSMPFYKLIAAASFILLLGSMILNYSYYRKYNNATNELQIAQQKIEQKQKSNLAMSEDLSVMTDKYARPVVLNGTANAPDAVARIFWMKNTGQVYVDPTNLPKVPAGKQYQLWAIVDGKPVDAGLITTEKGTYHIQKMKSFGKAEAFAITLEKEGGSPTPTMSEMVVISKM
jgi:hypothetical protein